MRRGVLVWCWLLAGSLSIARAEKPAPEAPAGDKESLRRLLAAGMDGVPLLHHALDCESSKPGEETWRFVVEIFREGDRAGLLLEPTPTLPAERGRVLGVTDGNVVVMRMNGADVVSELPGVRSLNARVMPFDRARKALGERWGVALDDPPWRVHFDLHVEDGDVPAFKFALQTSRVTWPGRWLDAVYLEPKALIPEEDGTTVALRGKNTSGRLSKGDGLPVEWLSGNPTTGGAFRGTATAPTWPPERWRTEIDAICRNREPNYWFPAQIGGTGRTIPLLDLELGHLLRDAATALPALPRESAKLRDLAVEAVAADLRCEGMTDVPPGTSREGWNGKVAERTRGIHRAVELGLRAWTTWQREPLANLMVEELRRKADALWCERGTGTK